MKLKEPWKGSYVSKVNDVLTNLKNKMLKEFYFTFTHDWPPVFYTEEEMPRIANKVGDFICKVIEQVAKSIEKERYWGDRLHD